MKRFAVAVAVAVTLLVPLAGCSGSSGPSENSIDKWVSAEGKTKIAPDAGVIGVAGSASDSSSSDARGQGITFGPDSGRYTVTGLEARCYGAEKLVVHYLFAGRTSAVGADSDPIACDKRPHAIKATADDVTSITINGLRTPTLTGWYVTVRGTRLPSEAEISAWDTENSRNVSDAAPPHTLIAGLLGAAPGNPADVSSLSKAFTPAEAVRTVQVACYGAPSMRLRLTVSGTTHDDETPITVRKTDPIPCDQDTHVEKMSIDDAAKIEVIGTDVTSDTSYLVFVTGSEK